MAAIAPTITDVSRTGDNTALLVQWAAVTESDTFAAVQFPDYSPVAVQVEGTFGASTTVLNGSLDGTNYHGLSDLSGTAISFTASGYQSVRDQPIQIQPSASGGTAQSITVSLLFVHRATRLSR
ncbi:MAG: hypothetical protein ACP5QR_05205 [Rhizomicrobium sp.]